MATTRPQSFKVAKTWTALEGYPPNEIETGAESKPESISSFPPSLQPAKPDPEIEEEASKASAAAKAPKAKIAEQPNPKTHGAKGRTKKPKQQLTRMQREIADHNKPPIPRIDRQTTQEPEEATVEKPNSHISRQTLSNPPEDLMVAGARILSMIKKDSPERRRAYEILEEMKIAKAKEQEETKMQENAKTTEQEEEEPIKPAPPSNPAATPSENSSPSQQTRAIPGKRKREDVDGVPQKSKRERELAKLAPYNGFGRTELEGLSRRRRRDL